jgi:hypothetical protein
VIAYFDTSAYLHLIIDESGPTKRSISRRVRRSGVLGPAVSEARADLAMARRPGRLSRAQPAIAHTELKALFADLALVSATPTSAEPATSANPKPSSATTSPPGFHRSRRRPPETIMVAVDHHFRIATLNQCLAIANLPRRVGPADLSAWVRHGEAGAVPWLCSLRHPNAERLGLHAASDVPSVRHGSAVPTGQKPAWSRLNHLPLDERFICPQDHHCRL